jgi:hypothetical protein
MAYSLYDAAVTPAPSSLAPWQASSIRPPRIAPPRRSRNRLCCRTGCNPTCSASPARISDFAALNPGCELCVRGDMLACVVATSAHHREEAEDGNLRRFLFGKRNGEPGI